MQDEHGQLIPCSCGVHAVDDVTADPRVTRSDPVYTISFGFAHTTALCLLTVSGGFKCICLLYAESSLTQPQMVVMSDTEDPFVPLPDDLLVNLAESRAVVEALLDSLPTTFAGNAQVTATLKSGRTRIAADVRHSMRSQLRADMTREEGLFNVQRPAASLDMMLVTQGLKHVADSLFSQ